MSAEICGAAVAVAAEDATAVDNGAATSTTENAWAERALDAQWDILEGEGGENAGAGAGAGADGLTVPEVNVVAKRIDIDAPRPFAPRAPRPPTTTVANDESWSWVYCANCAYCYKGVVRGQESELSMFRMMPEHGTRKVFYCNRSCYGAHWTKRNASAGAPPPWARAAVEASD
jgi:hypothetical protein